MFHTGIAARFSARHHLIGPVGEAEEHAEHAHDYRVEWRVSVQDLDDNGFGVDIDRLEAVLGEVTTELDGAYLNELDAFTGIQPSVENLARYISTRTWNGLERAGADVARIIATEIRIWEHDDAWAAYVREIGGDSASSQ